MMTTKERIQSVIKEAERLELGRSHDFNQLDPATEHRIKHATSPKKAKSGAYYLDCARCGRAVIEGNLGSARDGNC